VLADLCNTGNKFCCVDLCGGGGGGLDLELEVFLLPKLSLVANVGAEFIMRLGQVLLVFTVEADDEFLITLQLMTVSPLDQGSISCLDRLGRLVIF